MPPMDPQGRSDAFQAGQSFGRFYLVQLIGEGGTSRIFKALQQPINRIVALKIPSFADAGQILTPDEFLSEATLMARLEHANVTRIYDFGVHEDKAFICMEYVDGWNLLELVEARGALPDSAVLAAGIQILEALSYAHSHDVLHLDLSPANVLVNRPGTAKLSDFGMAGKKTRSAEGRIVGTAVESVRVAVESVRIGVASESLVDRLRTTSPALESARVGRAVVSERTIGVVVGVVVGAVVGVGEVGGCVVGVV